MNQNFYYAEAIEWAYRNKIVASYLTWLETPLGCGERECYGFCQSDPG